MDISDPALWKAQWEAFTAAPVVIVPMIIAVATGSWWLTSQFGKSAIESYKNNAKAATEQAKRALEAAEANGKKHIDVLNERIKFSEEKEIELRRTVDELKAAVANNSPPIAINKKTERVDAAMNEFSNANNKISSAANDSQSNFMGVLKDIGEAAVRIIIP